MKKKPEKKPEEFPENEDVSQSKNAAEESDYNTEGEQHTTIIRGEQLLNLRKKTKCIPALTILEGPRAGTIFQFPAAKKRIIIGRIQADFVISDDTVSRSHARFTRLKRKNQECFELEDLNSTNGTYLNGRNVIRAPLLPGDKINLGDVLLQFDLYDPIDLKYRQNLARKISEADKDEVTGLYSRKYLKQITGKIITKYKGSLSALCICMTDLDHFKSVNDRFGHPAGDDVLKVMGKLLRENLRTNDIPIRYGGEEFLIILPDCTSGSAHTIIERIRCALESYDFSRIDPEMSVTSSFGIAELQHSDDFESLLKRADQALYQAKKNGRNRVCIV